MSLSLGCESQGRQARRTQRAVALFPSKEEAHSIVLDGESEARVGRGVARWLVGVHLTGIAAALGLHLAVPPAVPERACALAR